MTVAEGRWQEPDMGKTHTIGIIGCSRMGRLHIQGYLNDPRCTVVGACDIDRGRAEAFVTDHDLTANVYTDFEEMIAKEKPDLVSVCLWTRLHLPVVTRLAELGAPAVHCEKPIAPTWGEAKQLVQAAEAAGMRLTFNHERRFGPTFRTARDLLFSGEYGDLVRMEAYVPANILDWGTHLFDLLHMYNREVPVQWVMAQIDAREVRQWFQVQFEFAAVASLRFENGIRAIVHVGDDKEIDLGVRIHATKGILEPYDECGLRTLKYGEGVWHDREFEGGPSDRGPVAISGVVRNLIDTLESGREPELSAERALRSTEAIFAAYESARRRARTDLPIDIEDNPFLTMLENGVIGPQT